MGTTQRKRVDFEFTFGERKERGQLSRINATSQEGLEGSLVSFRPDFFNDTYFKLERNEEIIDGTILTQCSQFVTLNLWEIDDQGTEIIFHRENSIDFFNDGNFYLQAPIGAARKYWEVSGKRIKLSLWIPSAAFTAEKSAVQLPPEIEDFKNTPITEALMSETVPTDFTLVSEKDGEEVKCHQCILYITGEFFQKIIDNCLDPANKRDSSSLPFSGKTLELIKKYVYRQEISFVETDDFEEIVNAGTMMMFPGAKMNSAQMKRRIDFEFPFSELEGPLGSSFINTTSQGLRASLEFHSLSGYDSRFQVLFDEEMIDEIRIDEYEKHVELVVWEIDQHGLEIFLHHEFLQPGDNLNLDLYLVDRHVPIPRYFWMMLEKRIKISVWIPSVVFIERKSEPGESISDNVPDGSKVPSPPEEFVKIPMNEALMSDNVPTDFTLVSEKDGKEVKCHQCVLYITGEYFQKIIDNCLDPGNQRNSAILPFSGKALELTKKYIYRQKISLEETDDVEEMVDAGTMTMFPGLVKECENYIIENLNSKDKYDMLVLARRFNLGYLKTKILSLAAKDASFREKLRSHNDSELVFE